MTLAAIDLFAYESNKRKSFEYIDYDNIAMLEARVRAIEGVDLYDLVQAANMC